MPTQSRHRLSLARIGVLGQIGHAPAFYALMALVLPIATAALLVSTARNAASAVSFGGAQGVGTIAFAVTLGSGAAGVLGGSLIDRFPPRVLLGAACLAMSASTALLWSLLGAGTASPASLIALSAIDGALATIAAVSVIKAQAGTVPTGARGAAEAVNSVRGSLGSIAGVLLGSRLGFGAPAVLLAAVLLAVVGIVLLATASAPRSARPLALTAPGSFTDFLRVVRGDAALRDVVVADLLMFLALPSALLAMGVVAEELDALNPVLITAGIVGVLGGRLVVAGRGTGGTVARDLTVATLAYAAITLAAWALLLPDGWLLDQAALMAVMAVAASGCGAFTQAMLAVRLQERLPDDLRGRGTGLVSGLRALQLAIGVALATWVVARFSFETYLLAVAIVLVVVTAGLRGFRRIES